MRIPRILYVALLLLVAIGALSGAVLADAAKVTICHFPPGNPENVQVIEISENAVDTHVGLHDGDFVMQPGDLCPASVDDEDDEENGHTPVSICHLIGNGNYNLIVVDDDAVDGHLGHGDKLPVNGACPPDEPDDECENQAQVATNSECPPPPDDCEQPSVQTEGDECPPPDDCDTDFRTATNEECPPPDDECDIDPQIATEEGECPPDDNEDCEEIELSAVVDETEEECPPDDDDTPRTPRVVVQQVPTGYQIRVWSEIPAGGVGWLILDGSGTWHMVFNSESDELPLRTNIEYRDRPNESFEGAPVEYNVPMSALILGPDNHNYDPHNYQAFDWQRYVDTGEVVLVGVHYDLHCEWGNAPLVGGVENQVCGNHDNRQVAGD